MMLMQKDYKVNMKPNITIRRFGKSVERYLNENFDIPFEESVRMVQDSSFTDMLDEDPNFVLHYSVSYWAKEIIEEYELQK